MLSSLIQVKEFSVQRCFCIVWWHEQLGLHPILRGWTANAYFQHLITLYALIHKWILTSPSKTRYIQHEITALQESDLAPSKRTKYMKNKEINSLNIRIRYLIEKFSTAFPGFNKLILLPINNLTRYGDVKPLGDGMHYQVKFRPQFSCDTKWGLGQLPSDYSPFKPTIYHTRDRKFLVLWWSAQRE